MNRFLTLTFTFVLLFAIDQTAFAQYRTTASRVRDLESRVQEMISLNEAFLPTIERMNSRLEVLDTQVMELASSTQRYEAQADVAELQRRLARMEQWYESTNKRQTWGPEELAWLRSEYDILTARLDGIEGRIDQLAQQRHSAYYPASGTSQYQQPASGTYAFRPRNASAYYSQPNTIPASSSFDVYEAPASAFDFNDQATVRLIIEIRVVTDRDGNITSYRMVR